MAFSKPVESLWQKFLQENEGIASRPPEVLAELRRFYRAGAFDMFTTLEDDDNFEDEDRMDLIDGVIDELVDDEEYDIGDGDDEVPNGVPE